MAKVVMHKANDGTLFEKAKDCEAHNMKLRLKPAVQEFAGGLIESASIVAVDGSGDLAVFLDDLPEFVATHANELRKLLNDALVVRKPRKASKLAASSAQA